MRGLSSSLFHIGALLLSVSINAHSMPSFRTPVPAVAIHGPEYLCNNFLARSFSSPPYDRELCGRRLISVFSKCYD